MAELGLEVHGLIKVGLGERTKSVPRLLPSLQQPAQRPHSHPRATDGGRCLHIT